MTDLWRCRPLGIANCFGGARGYCDRETRGWRLISGPKGGEPPIQRATAAIKAGIPTRLMARRML